MFEDLGLAIELGNEKPAISGITSLVHNSYRQFPAPAFFANCRKLPYVNSAFDDYKMPCQRGVVILEGRGFRNFASLAIRRTSSLYPFVNICEVARRRKSTQPNPLNPRLALVTAGPPEVVPESWLSFRPTPAPRQYPDRPELRPAFALGKGLDRRIRP